MKGRIGRNPHGHHGWLSRDYAEIDCMAEGCVYCHDRKCRVPSLWKINGEGRCEGFTARKKLPDIEEWRP